MENNTIILSFIVPIYNGALYIKECVEQILKNPNRELYEILLINDGSTDQSGIICKQLEKDYPRTVHAVDIENGGVSRARNYGIKNAHGKYIAFVDQDDFVSENFIFYTKLQEKESDIIILNWQGWESRILKENKPTPEKEVVFLPEDKEELIANLLYPTDSQLKDASLVFPWGKLYKRDFLLENNLYFNPEVLICEDVFFNIKCFLAYKKITYVKNTGYYYYNNRTSAGSSYNENACSIGIKSNELITDLLSDINSDKIRKANYYSILYRYWWCVVADFYHVQNKDHLLKRADRMKKLKEESCYRNAFNNLDNEMLSVMDFNQRLIMKQVWKGHFLLASCLCKLRILMRKRPGK